MKMTKVFKLLFSLVLLLNSLLVYSQRNKVFNYYLQRLNLEYNKPPGFIESDTLDKFAYRPHSGSGLLGGFSYRLILLKNDLMICFYVYDTDTSGKVMSPQYSYSENNYKRIVNSLLDTTSWIQFKNGKPVQKAPIEIIDTNIVTQYKGKELKWYNADDAGIFTIPIKNPYLGRYNFCKAFYMYKTGEGEVFVYYFYNEGVPIDEILKATEGLLRFKKKPLEGSK